jgi:hypothetical protein
MVRLQACPSEAVQRYSMTAKGMPQAVVRPLDSRLLNGVRHGNLDLGTRHDGTFRLCLRRQPCCEVLRNVDQLPSLVLALGRRQVVSRRVEQERPMRAAESKPTEEIRGHCVLGNPPCGWPRLFGCWHSAALAGGGAIPQRNQLRRRPVSPLARSVASRSKLIHRFATLLRKNHPFAPVCTRLHRRTKSVGCGFEPHPTQTFR